MEPNRKRGPPAGRIQLGAAGAAPHIPALTPLCCTYCITVLCCLSIPCPLASNPLKASSLSSTDRLPMRAGGQFPAVPSPGPNRSTGSAIAKEKGPVYRHGAFSQAFDVSSYADAAPGYSDRSFRRISHQAMLARPVVAAAPAAATGAARCIGLGAALATTSQSSSHSPLHSTPCPG